LLGGTTAPGSDAGALSAVDLFDPDSNTLSVLPALRRGRRGCAAAYTRGSLVVFGGSGASDASSTSERLGLEDASWSDVRVPGLARSEARAVRSGGGHLIVVGGDQVAERYWPRGFAATEGFDLLRTAARPRARHSATLLGNGEVLIAGGTAGIDSGLATSELFTPRTNSFRDGPTLSTARQDHAAVELAGGALLVGGRNLQGVVATAELYNPALDRWEAAGTLLTPRWGATASIVAGGQVLVAGGFDALGNALGSLELWSPATRQFTPAGSLSAPRGDHDAVPSGAHVVLGGGSNAAGPLDTVDLVAASNLFLGTATEGVGRAGASLSQASGSGIVLLSGGRDATGTLRPDLRFVDTRVFPFQLLPDTKPLFTPRAEHRARSLLDRRTLLVGGRNARGGLIDEGELYSFALAATVQGGVMTRTPDRRTHLARVEHTLTVLSDRRMLIVGGFDERGTALGGAEAYVPR
ncbi:MAG: hypothetical protein KDD82_20165, partial [Planctomycetes bacterium]|nr:hypothetical protein [Planctomycetota bacterium]